MHIDIHFFSLYTISKIAFDQYSSGILYKYINNFPDWKFFFRIYHCDNSKWSEESQVLDGHWRTKYLVETA